MECFSFSDIVQVREEIAKLSSRLNRLYSEEQDGLQTPSSHDEQEPVSRDEMLSPQLSPAAPSQTGERQWPGEGPMVFAARNRKAIKVDRPQLEDENSSQSSEISYDQISLPDSVLGEDTSLSDLQDFSAVAWHAKVSQLVGDLQKHRQWNLLAGVRDTTTHTAMARAALEVTMNLREEAQQADASNCDAMRATLDDEVEVSDMKILHRMGGFHEFLRAAGEKHQRRGGQRKRARALTFSNMVTAVRYPSSNDADCMRLAESLGVEYPAKRAGMHGDAQALHLLTELSQQQSEINALDAQAHLAEQRRTAHDAAYKHLRRLIAGETESVKAPEGYDEVIQAAVAAAALALPKASHVDGRGSQAEEGHPNRSSEIHRLEEEVRQKRERFEIMEKAGALTSSHTGTSRLRRGSRSGLSSPGNPPSSSVGPADTGISSTDGGTLGFARADASSGTALVGVQAGHGGNQATRNRAAGDDERSADEAFKSSSKQSVGGTRGISTSGSFGGGASRSSGLSRARLGTNTSQVSAFAETAPRDSDADIEDLQREVRQAESGLRTLQAERDEFFTSVTRAAELQRCWDKARAEAATRPKLAAQAGTPRKMGGSSVPRPLDNGAISHLPTIVAADGAAIPQEDGTATSPGQAWRELAVQLEAGIGRRVPQSLAEGAAILDQLEAERARLEVAVETASKGGCGEQLVLVQTSPTRPTSTSTPQPLSHRSIGDGKPSDKGHDGASRAAKDGQVGSGEITPSAGGGSAPGPGPSPRASVVGARSAQHSSQPGCPPHRRHSSPVAAEQLQRLPTGVTEKQPALVATLLRVQRENLEIEEHVRKFEEMTNEVKRTGGLPLVDQAYLNVSHSKGRSNSRASKGRSGDHSAPPGADSIGHRSQVNSSLSDHAQGGRKSDHGCSQSGTRNDGAGADEQALPDEEVEDNVLANERRRLQRELQRRRQQWHNLGWEKVMEGERVAASSLPTLLRMLQSGRPLGPPTVNTIDAESLRRTTCTSPPHRGSPPRSAPPATDGIGASADLGQCSPSGRSCSPRCCSGSARSSYASPRNSGSRYLLGRRGSLPPRPHTTYASVKDLLVDAARRSR